eukprot:1724062-Rhodomonas_salina.2
MATCGAMLLQLLLRPCWSRASRCCDDRALTTTQLSVQSVPGTRSPAFDFAEDAPTRVTVYAPTHCPVRTGAVLLRGVSGTDAGYHATASLRRV